MAAKFQLPDPTPVEQLPRSVEQLQALRQADRAQVAQALEQQVEQRIEQRLAAEFEQRVATEVAHKVQEILERWRLAQHRMFGRSSEAHPGQAQLFNEAELEAHTDSDNEDAESVDTPAAQPTQGKQPTRRRGNRRPLPPELPRIEHPHCQATCRF